MAVRDKQLIIYSGGFPLAADCAVVRSGVSDVQSSYLHEKSTMQYVCTFKREGEGRETANSSAR